ncbi:MAG TPA: class I SAM-dependent methyltransferase [Syntrophomonadaceae bacterium]|nr:class I SAM-dependent methyltransferase [Syntrophomonadaceae bacterium]
MNIDYFDQLWEKEKDYKEGYKAGIRDSWDKRAEEFNRNEPDERIHKISKLLLEKHMLEKESTVLDIGCGPGKFVLAFAQKAKKAVGVDVSPNMLKYASENASALGLENTEFKELDWEKADVTALGWRKKFSLVTAIMSPVINSRKNLEKMIEASNEYCLLTHFLERQDSINDVLKKDVLGWDHDDKYGNTALYCSLNILWLKGLFPEIFYFDSTRERKWALERANKHYINKLEMRNTLTESQKLNILEYLGSIAKDGMVEEKITSKIACIYWRNEESTNDI